MLAYVFSHWKQAGVAVADYESRQRAFHAALTQAPPAGYRGSFSAAISEVPWAATGGAAYEDWYWVDDFAAVGALNEAAVSGSRAAPHDAAAALASDGVGALYGLRLGVALPSPRFANWFSKPAGMRYPQLIDELAPRVASSRGALWIRQMTLGPSPEFCLHTLEPVGLPANLGARAVELRSIWPDIHSP